VGGLTLAPLGSLPLGGDVHYLSARSPPQGGQAYYHPLQQQYAPPAPQITHLASVPLALAPFQELEIPSFNGDANNFENWYEPVEAVLTQPMWQNILLCQQTTPQNAPISHALWDCLITACNSKVKIRLRFIDSLKGKGIEWLAAMLKSYNSALLWSAGYALLPAFSQEKRKNNESLEQFALHLQRDYRRICRSGVPNVDEE